MSEVPLEHPHESADAAVAGVVNIMLNLTACSFRELDLTAPIPRPSRGQ